MRCFMRVLSLGVNMFELFIHQQESYPAYLEDSLFRLLKEHQIDVALLQEVRSSKLQYLPTDFQAILPFPYHSQPTVDFRNHMTVALHLKQQQWFFQQNYLNPVAGKYMVSIRNPAYWTILGVHMPLLLKRNEDKALWEHVLLDEQHWHLIMGNFNAHNKKPLNHNWQLMQRLTKGEEPLYRNLWQEGLEQQKAYYLDYRGEKHLANETHFYRTTNSNTQIDYALGRNIDLNEIILDMRTLSFTNHCALIVDCCKR